MISRWPAFDGQGLRTNYVTQHLLDASSFCDRLVIESVSHNSFLPWKEPSIQDQYPALRYNKKHLYLQLRAHVHANIINSIPRLLTTHPTTPQNWAAPRHCLTGINETTLNAVQTHALTHTHTHTNTHPHMHTHATHLSSTYIVRDNLWSIASQHGRPQTWKHPHTHTCSEQGWSRSGAGVGDAKRKGGAREYCSRSGWRVDQELELITNLLQCWGPQCVSLNAVHWMYFVWSLHDEFQWIIDNIEIMDT